MLRRRIIFIFFFFKSSNFEDKKRVQNTYNGVLSRPLHLIPKNIGKENIRGANVYIETHRGCHGNCGFCQVPYFFGRSVISRPLDEIIEEVKSFKQKWVKKITISGGTGSLYGSEKFSSVDEKSFIALLKEWSAQIGPKNLTVPDIRIDMVTEAILEAPKMQKYPKKNGPNQLLKLHCPKKSPPYL